MKSKILPIAVFLLSFSLGILASPTDGIIAYPVPYNPGKGVMKIADTSGALTGSTVELSVFDINGDKVMSRSFVGFTNTYWNGRNESGTKVSPGLYIIKVTVETPSGYVGNKMIRILVQY